MKSYVTYLMTLLDELCIDAHFVVGSKGGSALWRGIVRPIIVAPMPTGLISFAIAMHEIGHVQCMHGNSDLHGTTIDRELEAWGWAEKQMRRDGWWNDVVEAFMWQCLGSYEKVAE